MLVRLSDSLLFALSLVRTMQNSGCNINRLPVELLTSIFDHIPHSAFDRFEDDFLSYEQPSSLCHSLPHYMSLQHVCRHWRRAFVGHSSFFTTVVLQQLRKGESIGPVDTQVKSYISKSGSLPLSVYMATPLGISVVAEHSHRLQRLHVEYIDADADESDSNGPQRHLKAFVAPAPLLEHLDLHISHPHDPAPSLPLMFSDTTPRLRKLNLSGFYKFSGNHFSRLTHLCVHGKNILVATDVQAVLLEELLSLLRGKLVLEELYLSSLVPWIDLDSPSLPEESEDSRIVLSRRLRRFSVSSCSVAQLRNLFSRIKISEGTSLSVTEIVGSNDPLFDIFAGSSGSAHFAFGNLMHLHTLILDRGRIMTGSIIAFGSSGAVRIVAPSQNRGFHDIQRFPFAHNIQELCIFAHETDHSDWGAVIEHLPSLHHLYTVNLHSTPILQALLRTRFHPDLQQPRTICKNLRYLTIIGDDEMYCSSPTSAFFNLISFVEARHRMRFPIQHLRVEPDLPGEDLEAADDWLDSVLKVLEESVETVELNASLQFDWSIIPAHLNEDVYSPYWPVWGKPNSFPWA